MLQYNQNIITSNNLQQLGLMCGTDKSRHTNTGKTYLDVYEQYFRDIQYNPLNILEIGVKNGFSHTLWENYFVNSKIFGIDIDPRCKNFETSRTKIIIGSQGEQSTIEELLKLTPKFDIILDDGSHINHLTIKSYELLISSLNPGGYYIIEDLANSYDKNIGISSKEGHWPGQQHNDNYDSFINNRADMNLFFNKLISSVDNKETLEYIHFYPWISIMKKRQNDYN